MPAAAAPSRRASGTPAPTSATSGRAARPSHDEGHGRRLTAAFEALESFPALEESRRRVLHLLGEDQPSTAELVAAVEADVALATAVLRMAGRVTGPRGGVDSVARAVSVLSPQTVQAIATRVRTFDFFDRASGWDGAPERFRLHALATQRAADRIGAHLGHERRDRLVVAALLHDVGKLVLIHAYPGYPEKILVGAGTPEQRIQKERRELGVDHALVGGVLVRRWGIDPAIASSVERHHAPDAHDEAAMIRLGDMLAHYGHGEGVDPGALLAAARALDLGPGDLRTLIYDLSGSASFGSKPRSVEPSPLSRREVEVLSQLAEGKVYKQIAHELELSTSTVRTHLHNIYGKLGAVDRAQAVLSATEHGWI